MVDIEKDENYHLNNSMTSPGNGESQLRRRLVQGTSEDYNEKEGGGKNGIDAKDINLELDNSSGEENQALLEKKAF